MVEMKKNSVYMTSNEFVPRQNIFKIIKWSGYISSYLVLTSTFICMSTKFVLRTNRLD